MVRPTKKEGLLALVSIGVIVAVVYVAWIVMTPFHRFPFLTTIRFERLLMMFGWVVALVAIKRDNGVIDKYCVTLILFLLVLYISHLTGPYNYRYAAIVWSDEYWKRIVFFFLLVFLIAARKDIHWFVLGSAFAITLYQTYSLLDFARGGSYVYQQGIARAIGVWSGGGIGAANAFGSLGLFSLPFAIYRRETARDRRQNLIGIGMIGVSMIAIFLSGTRGALVSGALVLIIAFRKKFLKASYLALFAVFLSIVWVNLPPDVKARYLSILPMVDTAETTNETAESSAQSRIEGLKDGWRLFKERPVLGYGPASSPYARIHVSEYIEFDPANPRYLQLHNLYGQVMSESGFLGTLLFAMLLWWVWRTSVAVRRIDAGSDPADSPSAVADFLFLQLIGVFSYGMFSHNLYSYYWLYIFAVASMATRFYLSDRTPRVGLVARERPTRVGATRATTSL